MGRRRQVCGQPMPNAHGEPSGHVVCTLTVKHRPPHVCETDYVRHTWEPPGATPAPLPKPKPPKPAAKPKRPPQPKRRPPRKRRRRTYRRRSPLAEGLLPLAVLIVMGGAVHALSRVLPYMA